MLNSGSFPLLYDNKEANHKQQLYVVTDGYWGGRFRQDAWVMEQTLNVSAM